MSEQNLLLIFGAFIIGLVCGVAVMMLFNKARSGSVSAGKVKQEMDDYQAQVEAHFDQTSKKFESLSSQYQDLYQHLSVGATSLCRPENISIGLSDQTDPLTPKIESVSDESPPQEPEPTSEDKLKNTSDTESSNGDAAEPSTEPEQK